MFLALILVGMFAFRNTQPVEAAGFQVTVLGTATTSTAVAVTSSTRVLASTTNPLGTPGVTSFNRVYASICNPNANPVYISLNGDKAASNSSATAVIAAAAGYNVCYFITDVNQYSGSITASSTNQTSTSVTVSDYVQ